MRITVHLVGSNGAEFEFEDQPGATLPYQPNHHKGVVPSLARQLLENGEASPEDTIHVLRGDTQVFKDLTVGQWADKTVSEGDRTTAKITKYQPFPKEALNE